MYTTQPVGNQRSVCSEKQQKKIHGLNVSAELPMLSSAASAIQAAAAAAQTSRHS